MELLEFYRNHLTKSILPFWARAVDDSNGGVYTCFDNSGKVLSSKNKFTWSQGRFIWLMAHLAELCERKLVEGDPGEYRDIAAKAIAFLKAHVFLENGNCAFLLSETGDMIESSPGSGYDSSIFADCFYSIGLCEYARVFKETAVLEDAKTLYDSIAKRLSSGNVKSEPYPIPAGYRSHGFPMIMLHLSEQLAGALAAVGDGRRDSAVADCAGYLADIMENFRRKDEDVIAEILAPVSAGGSILARHLNPGHTIECMWFVIRAAELTGKREYIDIATRLVERAFELGWDKEEGGLLHYVDRSGGKPSGSISGGSFENLVSVTWDMKLWWPHSEALYSTLLAFKVSRDAKFLGLYRKLHYYAFRVFPNPDVSVGEWIQVRDRKGIPEDKVVALPVKDPYHVMRNVMLIIELLSVDEIGRLPLEGDE